MIGEFEKFFVRPVLFCTFSLGLMGWMPFKLFAVSKPNISMLIAKIFAEKELDDSVVKFYLTTAADGKRYNVIYNALEAMKKRLLFPQKDMRRLTTFGARRSKAC